MKKAFILLIFLAAIIAIVLVNQVSMTKGESQSSQIDNENLEEAIFAGGCFWCNEAAFEEIEGVSEVISGYTGGDVINPSYEQVITGTTGHREAVKVFYDPEVISYEELVESFWRQINPTDAEGQFVDKGSQYTTAIYYETEEEREIAEKSKEEISNKFDEPIVTEVLPEKVFYEAEEYHQDYSKKRTLQYKAYVMGSGRGILKDLWGE